MVRCTFKYFAVAHNSTNINSALRFGLVGNVCRLNTKSSDFSAFKNLTWKNNIQRKAEKSPTSSDRRKEP